MIVAWLFSVCGRSFLDRQATWLMLTCLILTHPGDIGLLPIARAFACGDPVAVWYVEKHRAGEEFVPIGLDELPDDTAVRRVRQNLSKSAEHSVLSRKDPAEASGSDAGRPEDTNAQEQHADVPLEKAGAWQLFRLRSEHPVESVVAEIHKQGIHLLVLPRHESSRKASEQSLERALFNRCPCDMLYVSCAGEAPASCQNLLVATQGNHHANIALACAAAAAQSLAGCVTALYVQPELDEVSLEVGQRSLTKIAHRAGVRAGEHVRLRVETAENLQAGIQRALENPCDLLLFGASEGREAQRIMSGSAPIEGTAGAALPAVGVMRAAIPLSGRIQRRTSQFLQRHVPQLNRDQRIALVERIEASSQRNFDFTTLMCLSTLIAALGLLQNSTAVVIGAMLIAPLMTPLVAVGLAIVHGNRLLLRTAQWTVFQGFVLAFVIAFLLGITANWLSTASWRWPTEEMWARGSPSILDLFIAFVSGMAAAYAMGRPNLLSALPGVAIAAALVPPIATSGMALALGEFRLAAGAITLFLTNIVAIVLATCVSLWSVGVRDGHRYGTQQRWSPRIAVLLCLLAVALAIFESRPRLSTVMIEQMKHIVEEKYGCNWLDVSLNQTNRGKEIVVAIESQTTELPELLNRLKSVAAEHVDSDVNLRVEVEIVHQSE
jgi:uncharacterized hydrophobic protein (TIGR00271 family)